MINPVEIYRKRIDEPDSAYVLVTNMNDGVEQDASLEPDTIYKYKKVEEGKPDLFTTARTLPEDGTLYSGLYI